MSAYGVSSKPQIINLSLCGTNVPFSNSYGLQNNSNRINQADKTVTKLKYENKVGTGLSNLRHTHVPISENIVTQALQLERFHIEESHPKSSSHLYLRAKTPVQAQYIATRKESAKTLKEVLNETETAIQNEEETKNCPNGIPNESSNITREESDTSVASIAATSGASLIVQNQDESEVTHDNTLSSLLKSYDCPEAEITWEKTKRKKHKRKRSKRKSSVQSNSGNLSKTCTVDQLQAYCQPVKLIQTQKANQFPSNKTKQVIAVEKRLSVSKPVVRISCEPTMTFPPTNNSKSDTRSATNISTNNMRISINNHKHSPKKQISPYLASMSKSAMEEITKLTKIFLSDRQSGTVSDMGVDLPCAPPATPTLEMMKKYEYVPSLNDIRSQRAVKMRLENLYKIEKEKKEKIKEEKLRQEKHEQKEKIKELRRKQRKEIYALNKVMTEFENRNFLEFCKKNGIPPD